MIHRDRALALLALADPEQPAGLCLAYRLTPGQYAELLCLLRERRERTDALLAAVDATLKGVCWDKRPGSLRDRLSAAAEAVRGMP